MECMAYPPIPVETFTTLLFFEQTRPDRVPFRCSAGSFRLAAGIGTFSSDSDVGSWSTDEVTF
jgi:hypothetical protein